MPICRLCLDKCSSNVGNIFQCKIGNCEEEDGLTNILFWTFGVEVDVGDSYSKTICSKCVSLVELVLKYRKKFQLNQELLKNGLSEIETPINLQNDWSDIEFGNEIDQSSVRVSCKNLDFLCARPTIIVRKLEESYTYQTYKKIGPRRFIKRKRPKLELDDSVVNDICKSLETSDFGDLSSRNIRSVAVNTSITNASSKQCDKCDPSNHSLLETSEDSNVDHDSGVENDGFVRDILQKSLNFDRKDDFDDWTQISFKKNVGTETAAIPTNSVAVSTEDLFLSHRSSTNLELDDFKKLKLKIKSTYFESGLNIQDSKNVGELSEKVFDSFVSSVEKRKIDDFIEAEEENLFKAFRNNLNKSYNTTGTITDCSYSEVSATCQTPVSKKTKERIVEGFRKKPKPRLKSVGTETDPLSNDRVVIDMDVLKIFSPVVEIIPLEYSIEEDYEQITDTTFVLKDQIDPELLKERKQRFIDYYYGFSSFGIRELVTGTTFREKEKENTNMSVCQVSSVCDIFICSLCGRQFARESALKTHSSLVHKNEHVIPTKRHLKQKKVTKRSIKFRRRNNTGRFRNKKRNVQNTSIKLSGKDDSNAVELQENVRRNIKSTSMKLFREGNSNGIQDSVELRENLRRNKLGRSHKKKINLQNTSLELFQKENSNAIEDSLKLQEKFSPTAEDLRYMQLKLQLSENNVEVVFSCTKCDLSCRNEKELCFHRKTAHSSNKSLMSNSDKEAQNTALEFICNKCDFCFGNQQLLYQHQAESHGIVSYSIISEGSSSSESETELVDVEYIEHRLQSNKNKKNVAPKYVWESKKFGKYSALSANKQKRNLLNISDESRSSKTVAPTKKNVRNYSSIEDDLETVRKLHGKLNVAKRRKSFLDGTISKLATRLDSDA